MKLSSLIPSAMKVWFGRSLCLAILLFSVATASIEIGSIAGEEQKTESVPLSEAVPYGQSEIDYYGEETDNPIEKLDLLLKSKQRTLKYDAQFGYLPALLKEWNIPEESQLLVFSKTALSPNLISPKTPRAIYFNDDFYIGWVPLSDHLEMIAFDSRKGAFFYVLPQVEATSERPLRFQRQNRCLGCHVSKNTYRVPGVPIRSFLTDRTGKPITGYSRISQHDPFSKRFGGWYVTGTHGKQTHSGNIFGKHQNQKHQSDPSIGSNVTDLSSYIDVLNYLKPSSDLIAHLVFHHQAEGHNLLTRVAYEFQLKRTSEAELQLLKHLFFANEITWKEPIRGTSNFAAKFEKRGPFDSQGHSLRKLNLKNRLFEYRLSYLIYSAQFHDLPNKLKERLYYQMWQVLQGTHPDAELQHLGEEERNRIIHIVRETKQNLPSIWKSGFVKIQEGNP